MEVIGNEYTLTLKPTTDLQHWAINHGSLSDDVPYPGVVIVLEEPVNSLFKG